MLQRALIVAVLSLGAAAPAFAAPIYFSSERWVNAHVQVRDANGQFVDQDFDNGSSNNPGQYIDEANAALVDPAGSGLASASQTSDIGADSFSGSLTTSGTSNTGTTYFEGVNLYFVTFDLLTTHTFELTGAATTASGYQRFYFCRAGEDPCIFDINSSSPNGAFSVADTLEAGRYQLYSYMYALGYNTAAATSINFNLTLTEQGATAPEPTSMLLLGTGLVGVGVRRWRHKRA